MSQSEVAFFEQVLHILGQLQQTYEVGNRGPVFSRTGGNLLLREAEFMAQALEGTRLLNRVEVFTLEVFNDGDLHRLSIGDFLNDSRNRRFSRAL